jgi:tetratricopeptide (TPR) repeat protein
MAAFKWWTSPPASLHRKGRRTARPGLYRVKALSLSIPVALCALASPVLAVPNDACIKDERCKEHHDKAVNYYSQQYYDEALVEFQAAYAARQMPLLLINIGRTLQKLGRPKEALDYYTRFQQAESKPDPAIATKLTEYIAQAKALIGSQPAPPPDQTTDPGKPPVNQPPAPRPPEPPPPGRNLMIVGGVVAGLGLGGIVAGGVLYAQSANFYSTFQPTSPNYSQDEFDQMAAKSSAQAYGLGSTLSYALGGVALAAGGALITVGALKLIKHRRSTATPPVKAAFLPSLGGGTMVLTGAY